MAFRTSTTSSARRPLALAGGLLALVAVTAPIAQSSAAYTSRSVNPAAGVTAAVDWTPPKVDLDTVYAIRNGATVAASASDAETGIRNVVLSWAPTGTQTWTAICTRAAPPYSCPVSTVGMPADIDIRAVATDNAGFSSTDLLEDVSVDNGLPTVAFGTLPKPMSGVVTVPATANDGETFVVGVTIEYRVTGGAAFTVLCTDTSTPYSCSFDTTKVPDGGYDLRATAVDLAGNQASTIAAITVDNRNASVSVVQPDPNYLRGLATVHANAFSSSAITSVAIEWNRSASGGTWTRLCADTAGPYSCDWDTTKVADGAVYLRAILTDAKGTVTSAVLGPVYIDNSLFRGVDVQASNGGTAGRPDAGDTITLTYSRVLNTGTVLSGWTGAAQPVTVRLRDGALVGLGGADDTVDVVTSSANNAASVHLGSVNLRTDQIKRRATATFAATMVHATSTVNGQQASTVTITLAEQTTGRSQELRTSTIAPSMVWTPSNVARDAAGAATSIAPVTELGAADRDL